MPQSIFRPYGKTAQIRCDARMKHAWHSIRPKPNIVGIVGVNLLQKKSDLSAVSGTPFSLAPRWYGFSETCGECPVFRYNIQWIQNNHFLTLTA